MLIRWLLVALACVGIAVATLRANRIADAEERVRLLEDNRLTLHGLLRQARESASVEYGARQCMVTVARGDYDEFLRQLGWQRPDPL